MGLNWLPYPLSDPSTCLTSRFHPWNIERLIVQPHSPRQMAERRNDNGHTQDPTRAAERETESRMEGIRPGSARTLRRTLAHEKSVDFCLFRVHHCVSHSRASARMGVFVPRNSTDSKAVSLCIVLFLTIPRAPNFKFPSADIIGVDNSTVSFSRTPTNFSFAGSINMIGMSLSFTRQRKARPI